MTTLYVTAIFGGFLLTLSHWIPTVYMCVCVCVDIGMSDSEIQEQHVPRAVACTIQPERWLRSHSPHKAFHFLIP